MRDILYPFAVKASHAEMVGMQLLDMLVELLNMDDHRPMRPSAASVLGLAV